MKIFIAQPLFSWVRFYSFWIEGFFRNDVSANLLNRFSFSYIQFNSIQIICSLEFNFQKLNTNEKIYSRAQIEWLLMPIKEINVG